MQAYQDLLKLVLARGRKKAQRAVLGDGRKPYCYSVFGHQYRINLQEGFPLVTTKSMSWRAVVGELCWFLSGSTNVNDLQSRGIRIWDQWAESDGDLGPVYGRHWRAWNGRVDQISNILSDLWSVVTDPYHSAGRRILLQNYNPAEIPKKAPYACHYMAQFDVTDGVLSCHMVQRSADLFLGVPYNIACYSLLTHLLALASGLQVGEFVHTFSDLHIYDNHLEQCHEQLARTPHPLPKLVVSEAIDLPRIMQDPARAWELFDVLKVEGYQCWPPLKGEVAV